MAFYRKDEKDYSMNLKMANIILFDGTDDFKMERMY
jgi:hypothetical protein